LSGEERQDNEEEGYGKSKPVKINVHIKADTLIGAKIDRIDDRDQRAKIDRIDDRDNISVEVSHRDKTSKADDESDRNSE
jgi:hypothetical protein